MGANAAIANAQVVARTIVFLVIFILSPHYRVGLRIEHRTS
jgi:hypothetical protein